MDQNKLLIDELTEYLVHNQAWFLGYREEIVMEDLKEVLSKFFERDHKPKAALLKDAG